MNDRVESTPLDSLLEALARTKRLFWPTIEKNYSENTSLFRELGEPMVEWAAHYLGPGFEQVLADGYSYFVTDVNKSQILYEAKGRYASRTYSDVYSAVYDNRDAMSKYHWGVFVTTFAWEHHLNIYRYYRDEFIPLLRHRKPRVLELGSGSGIWGMILLQHLSGGELIGVDISETSVDEANDMVRTNGLGDRVRYVCSDALTYRFGRAADAVLSCFLLEHLEQPERLMANMIVNLEPGGYAFMTAALTAAEADHIAEFRRESEIVLMAENAGFRVISYYSAEPRSYPRNFKFLPRSMALIMQKRGNDIW